MSPNKINKTERGWAGHFIGSKNCLFRRNTLVEKGEKKFVISTVGNWQIPIADETYEDSHEITHGVYYETSVFKAIEVSGYWDADHQQVVDFDSRGAVEEINVDSDHNANEMHEEVVREIIRKLNDGIL